MPEFDFQCTIEGCTKTQRMSRRVCDAHYTMISTYGSVNKICDLCGDEFIYVSRDLNARSFCAPCFVIYKEHGRCRPSMLRGHNLTVLKYLELFKAFEDKCGICGFYSKTDLYIDHDHNHCGNDYRKQTSRRSCGNCIRGLLCHPCNSMVGFYENCKGDLQIDVFEKWKAQPYFVFTSIRS